MRSISRFAAFVFLLIAPSSLIAQNTPDPHMIDAASVLYARSAFAHGYLHGYEQGFHLADLDIQMGHLLPGVQVRRDVRERDPHYRPAYGDKSLFISGFRLGMRAGYADSIAGVSFRAVTEMRQAATGLTPGRTSKPFDRGVYEGFLHGERQGAGDAHAMADFAGVTSSCLAEHPVKPEDGQPYCDGYTRGFQLGYSDGRAQRMSVSKDVQTAENGQH